MKTTIEMAHEVYGEKTFWTEDQLLKLKRLVDLARAEEREQIIAAQRQWVGLTDEEIWETISRIGTSDSDVNPYAKLADARAIEQRLKEKNTAVPDALTIGDKESPDYHEGWNDCRSLMLEMRKP